ncbi:Transport protein yif1 [Dimargaris verticillata]|uniref:Protein YIF1 n=1 Tax=Dimargaris verticillata TaxID=2761393 RepID=A0A9W8B1Z1_9FUNG|nr:Transport protein yif1 [Dimargaris verticillata]
MAQPYEGFDLNTIHNNQAAQLGLQFAGTAVHAGHEYVEKNINQYINVSMLRHYFNVSNSYVLKKIQLLLFPFGRKHWARLVQRSEHTGHTTGYKPPREDLNSPDLYIPVMALITYVLLVGIVSGTKHMFHPEILGLTASKAIAVVLFEVVLIKLGCYLLNISAEAQFLDLICYCGYKFIGIIATLLVGVKSPSWATWSVFFYTNIAVGFFLLRSLRHIVLPDTSAATATGLHHRKHRIYFLFIVAALQLVFSWILLSNTWGLTDAHATATSAPLRSRP